MKTETKPALLARRALSCLLAVVLAAGLAPLAPGEAKAEEQAQPREYMGFSDVYPGDWFATDDVLGYAVDRGLLQGYGDGSLFGPYDSVTRAQMATILWRVAGEPEADAEDFSDVDYAQWYGAAVEWARSTGVISGYGDSNAFGPEDPVTREQLAVMLSNHAEKVAGLDASSDRSALDAIAGASQVAPWARIQMGWAVDEGIVSGSVYAAGVAWVDPQGTAQRCQAAKMVSVFHRDVLPPEIDASYDNVIDYADDAKVIEGADYTVASDGSISVDSDDLAAGVEVGDKVILSPTEKNPEGAALEVTATTESGGRTQLSGVSPGFFEIFDSVDVEGVTLSEDIEVVPADGVELESDASSRAVADLGTFKFKYKDMSFKISPSAEFKLKTGWFSIEEAYLAATLNEEVAGKLVGVSNDFDKKLCDINMPTSVPMLRFSVAVWAEVSASGEVTLSLSNETTVGARYKDGKFKTIFKNESDVDIDISATARSGFDLTASLDILNKPTVDASLGAGAQFKAGNVAVRDTGMVCADVESALYADIGMGQHDSMMHDLGISWSKDLADVELATLHFENGNYVSKCTWKETPDVPSGDATPASDFVYKVLGDSDGLREATADDWGITFIPDTPQSPESRYCGPGVYITGYVGSDSRINVPASIEGLPVKFISFDWNDNGYNGVIDVSSCSNLEFLDPNGGTLVGISTLPELRYLDSAAAHLDNLDLDQSMGIEFISCSVNATNDVRGPVDLSGRRALRELSVNYHAGITSIDVSDCTSLERLYCSGYENATVESMDLRNTPNLEAIVCGSNVLETLDLSGKPKLKQLECGRNRLDVLDLSGNPLIDTLACDGNDLRSIDLRNLSCLQFLDCSDNPIDSLDISRNSELSSLICRNMPLVELNVSSNPLLSSLDCSDTEITQLDITANPELSSVICKNTAIEVLDISHNPELNSIDTSGCSLLDTSEIEEWAEQPYHWWFH